MPKFTNTQLRRKENQAQEFEERVQSIYQEVAPRKTALSNSTLCCHPTEVNVLALTAICCLLPSFASPATGCFVTFAGMSKVASGVTAIRAVFSAFRTAALFAAATISAEHAVV